MKTFFAFALALLAACTDDPTTPTNQQSSQEIACTTSADCPNATSVCVHPNATTGAGKCVPTSPVPSTCNPMSANAVACPVGTNCNPICSTTGIAGYQCEPAGVPTKVCPIACTPTPNSTTPSCPANYVCATACGSTTTTPNHICIPANTDPPVCM